MTEAQLDRAIVCCKFFFLRGSISHLPKVCLACCQIQMKTSDGPFSFSLQSCSIRICVVLFDSQYDDVYFELCSSFSSSGMFSFIAQIHESIGNCTTQQRQRHITARNHGIFLGLVLLHSPFCSTCLFPSFLFFSLQPFFWEHTRFSFARFFSHWISDNPYSFIIESKPISHLFYAVVFSVVQRHEKLLLHFSVRFGGPVGCACLLRSMNKWM